MDKKQIDLWVMSNNDKLDPVQLSQIRSRLEQIDEADGQTMMSAELKSPTTMLIISILVGILGVDRFMLGQVGMGILKLLTVGGLGILYIIDWINVSKMTREYNFRKMMTYLATM
jgi:TM2 domain-containing membrane protein YozV